MLRRIEVSVKLTEVVHTDTEVTLVWDEILDQESRYYASSSTNV